jgi:hypothetical protein
MSETSFFERVWQVVECCNGTPANKDIRSIGEAPKVRHNLPFKRRTRSVANDG